MNLGQLNCGSPRLAGGILLAGLIGLAGTACGGIVRHEGEGEDGANNDSFDQGSGGHSAAYEPGETGETDSEREPGVIRSDASTDGEACNCDPNIDYRIEIYDIRRNETIIYDQASPKLAGQAGCSTEQPGILRKTCEQFSFVACNEDALCAGFSYDSSLIQFTFETDDDWTAIAGIPSSFSYEEQYDAVLGSATIEDENGPVYSLKFAGCAVNEAVACP